MRNAVSLFEQLISSGNISYAYIVETLWIASEDEKKIFITKLIEKDISILDDFQELQASGKNLKNFFKEILGDIQISAITSLKSGTNISQSVLLMQELQDMLMKSKNSFDESTTFRIWLLKLLSWVQAPIETSTKPHIVVTQNIGVEQKVSIQKKEVKQEISQDAIIASAEDIFATSEILEKPTPKTQGSWAAFNIDSLIDGCRKHWWKAALSMTIKGADFDMQWDILCVKTKTKIALWTMEKTENREILMLALEDMGTPVSDIKVS
jgi:hypothetical protein